MIMNDTVESVVNRILRQQHCQDIIIDDKNRAVFKEGMCLLAERLATAIKGHLANNFEGLVFDKPEDCKVCNQPVPEGPCETCSAPDPATITSFYDTGYKKGKAYLEVLVKEAHQKGFDKGLETGRVSSYKELRAACDGAFTAGTAKGYKTGYEKCQEINGSISEWIARLNNAALKAGVAWVVHSDDLNRSVNDLIQAAIEKGKNQTIRAGSAYDSGYNIGLIWEREQWKGAVALARENQLMALCPPYTVQVQAVKEIVHIGYNRGWTDAVRRMQQNMVDMGENT